jgi:outer membrane receptor protein involved in Fe transport
MTRLIARRAGFAVLATALPSIISAQTVPARTAGIDSSARALHPVTITATREMKDIHDVAPMVSVIDSTSIRSQLPNSAADLLKSLPGVDEVNTGPNQGRPSIRGLTGQRILLLEDGMRLNNSRRQQDFGELPALVDVSLLDRVEVVRGPASVLYGSDAIGGAINLITRAPPNTGPAGISGRVGYLFGSAGDLGKADGFVSGHKGGWAFEVAGSGRVAGDYDAPSGSYGNVKLSSNTTLLNSGVRDHSLRVYAGWGGVNGIGAYVKVEQYVADNAGYGYVPPALLGGDQTKVEILYPHQDFQKLAAGFSSGTMQNVFADKVDVTMYVQQNKRNLNQNIFAGFGPGTPPGSGADIHTFNFTNIGTFGARVEASKSASGVVFTYGLDYFIDRSVNSDSSTTNIIGFGPTQTEKDSRASTPNATLSNLGVFAQGDWRLTDRFSLITGVRFLTATSQPTLTAGRTDTLSNHTNSTGVYALSAIYRATSALSLVATAGRGFRTPNLVERYFDGPTPEGSAYETASPNLLPETSFNIDAGLKYRAGRLSGELSVFRNDIHDAIEIAPTGAMNQGLPVYTNVNVGALRTHGEEVSAAYRFDHGISLSGNWSAIKSQDLIDPASPIGDTFSNKLNLALGWTDARGRFWAEYDVRRNGEQRDVVAGTSPVGDVYPSFTVHSVRGGVRGWSIGSVRQDITIAINNIGNALYAEAGNASFFRPEPGRNLAIGLSTAF